MRPSATFASVTVGGAAAAVTDRAGIGGALCGPRGGRPPSSRRCAAAGADLVDVDHRDGHRKDDRGTRPWSVRGRADDGALRRRAAHVERDVPVARRGLREARATWRPPPAPTRIVCTGFDRGRFERERAAIGLRDEHLAAEAAPAERPSERAEVAVHDGPDIGVDDGGARPLVLPPLLRDPMRRRDKGAGQLAGDDLGAALLVAGSRYEKRKTTATDRRPRPRAGARRS